MKKINPLSGTYDVPECTLLFNLDNFTTHNSQIMAGFKMLDDAKIIRIKNAEPCKTFRTGGHYEHNSMVEADFNGKIIAYDTADGYQSIHRKDVFDSQLDRLTYYFKRSYDESFHNGMRNADKVKSLGLNYFCTCKGNPYDKYYPQDGFKIKDVVPMLLHKRNARTQAFDYSMFESNSEKYDSYNLLFLTRLWDSAGITADSIQKTYPYFTIEEASLEAEKWKNSLDVATKDRIEYIRSLREHFGNRIIAGVSTDSFSQKLCPDLIIESNITDRNNFIGMIKKNYICLTSEGLHGSIGWKFAEYIAAGKAVITEPLAYTVPYGFEEDKNYFVYSDIESCIGNCEKLINNPELVHETESLNREYYSNHLRPDKLILDTLKIVFNK